MERGHPQLDALHHPVATLLSALLRDPSRTVLLLISPPLIHASAWPPCVCAGRAPGLKGKTSVCVTACSV